MTTDSNIFSLLNFYPLTLTYQAIQSAEFPEYQGSMLRGVFGDSLIQLEQEGVVMPAVDGIKISDYLFNNLLADSHPWHKEYKEPPRGFWFTMPQIMQKHYKTGDILQFTFTLCGEYVNFLPELFAVFIKMGDKGFGKRKGKFQLLSIANQTIGENSQIIWQSKQNSLQVPNKGISFSDFNKCKLISNSLVIHLITPTALNKHHDIYGGFPIMDFIEILGKRLTLLSNIYCAEQFAWDNKYEKDNIRNIRVVESNLRWEKFIRKSNRKNETAPVEGYKGTIIYQGNKSNIETYLPLLLLGQFTHIGRNIPFGGGKYIVDEKCYSLIL